MKLEYISVSILYIIINCEKENEKVREVLYEEIIEISGV